MKTPNYVFDDELYHYGILGQRWGHRRFQNEDGSWTPEGRERYSEGERERFAAKDAYKTQKYKAKLESRAIKDAARRAASEERYRVRQAAKTERAARKEALKNDKALMKEQSKADREQSRLNNKLVREQIKEKDTSTFKNALNRTKKYTMSDNELENAINRLKLEVEYNKQYALASKPNGALARADRFFEGATGKMVRDLAVQTIPNVANTLASNISNKLLESKLKYANELDREKAKADIEKTNAEAASFRTKADFQSAQADKERSIAENNRQKTVNEANEAQSKIKLDRAKEAREALGARAANALAKAADSRAAEELAQKLKISRSEAASKLLSEREEIKAKRLANRVEEATQFGYDAGDKAKKSSNWVYGKVSYNLAKEREGYENLKKQNNVQEQQGLAKAAIDNAKANSINAETDIKNKNANEARAARKEFNETVTKLATAGQIKVTEALNSYKFGESNQTSYKLAKEEAKTPINSKPVIDLSTNLNSLLRDKSNVVSNNESSRINSLLKNHTAEKVAEITGRSISTIMKYKR